MRSLKEDVIDEAYLLLFIHDLGFNVHDLDGCVVAYCGKERKHSSFGVFTPLLLLLLLHRFLLAHPPTLSSRPKEGDVHCEKARRRRWGRLLLLSGLCLH